MRNHSKCSPSLQIRPYPLTRILLYPGQAIGPTRLVVGKFGAPLYCAGSRRFCARPSATESAHHTAANGTTEPATSARLPSTLRTAWMPAPARSPPRYRNTSISGLALYRSEAGTTANRVSLGRSRNCVTCRPVQGLEYGHHTVKRPDGQYGKPRHGYERKNRKSPAHTQLLDHAGGYEYLRE